MCLAVPMQISTINGSQAICHYQGVEREAGLELLQDQPLAVGDFVLIHVGYAIAKIDPEEAKASWALFEQLADA
ncbi:MAG: HypC/HybG/HupF family hydrogenase formation chaperone [Methylococcales bacterium]|nr:HypC/HybG/HupF family hydrogenase formation chaperone [Methylococcales bacterium]